ncbi:Arm DNA-binding domain-containing protein [Larkinella rosea]|uniref:Arm DNA-binding domain-containing protein n=1 Tax=Larkinella rosea TaxID=2025312 RepID=UPI00163AE162|nr:Arm DNA-binding domain-containing protein [Larkinella rosea]
MGPRTYRKSANKARIGTFSFYNHFQNDFLTHFSLSIFRIFSEWEQDFSKKLTITDEYVKTDGTSALYLYVAIDDKHDRIKLKLSWPPAFLDKKAGQILPRKRNDPDFNDFKIIIDTEMGKLNDIFKAHRMAEKKLSLDKLIEVYHSFTSKNDFLKFWLTEVNERWKRNIYGMAT